MNLQAVERKFDELGARVVVNEVPTRRLNPAAPPVTMNVRNDKKGEHFVMNVNKNKIGSDGVELHVLDFDKKLVQMLLMVKEPIVNAKGMITGYRNDKLLCGHDERHWYVASVKPEATNIHTAFESLKPDRVKEVQKKVNPRKRNRRHNPAFIRQGEWFFIPVDFIPDYKPEEIRRNEPISRPGGSPHRVEEVLRFGGEKVYVRRNKIYSEKEFENLMATKPLNEKGDPLRPNEFEIRYRGARVLGRGTVRHRDHKTVHLKGWYEIHLSTEARTNANSFLD